MMSFVIDVCDAPAGKMSVSPVAEWRRATSSYRRTSYHSSLGP